MDTTKNQTTKKKNNNDDLMNRLRSFMPQMQSANQDLLQRQQDDDENDNKNKSTTIMTNKNTKTMQLDADLHLEDDSDSDSESDDDNDVDNDNIKPLIQEEVAEKEGNEKVEEKIEIISETTSEEATTAVIPTIQLQFSLGDMTGNPLMELLADNGDDDDDDDDDKEEDNDHDHDHDATNIDERTKLVSKLLASTKKTIQTEIKQKQQPQESSLKSIIPVINATTTSTKKKQLITEL